MSSQRHIALLRGVNVGGKNRLPMPELAAMFEAAGATAVQTYIQSGNVVCSASAKVASRLGPQVEQALLKRFGHAVPVVMRTAQQLTFVLRGNPWLAAGAEPESLHVAFLAAAPSAGAVAQLDPHRSPPDEFAVRGAEVFLRLPNGVAKTRLTNAWLDSKLQTVSTVRNWRTVVTLAELATR